ncbi:MAG: peptidyl-tRNA hydrolase Pth2 [bacterium]
MLKQVIIINNKLDMSAGKIAAQACHASLGAFLRADGRKIQEWQEQGQKKIICKSDDLIILKNLADNLEIANFLVKDAGLTELEPGAITALGLGPDQEEKIDKITGNLMLY